MIKSQRSKDFPQRYLILKGDTSLCAGFYFIAGVAVAKAPCGQDRDFVVFPNLPGIAEANLFGCPVPLEPAILPMLERIEAIFVDAKTR